MTLYRHVKRGTIYESLGEYHLWEFSREGDKYPILIVGETLVEAEMQYSGGEKLGSRYAGPIMVYRGTDNKVWFRPSFEFHDGRFEEVK